MSDSSHIGIWALLHDSLIKAVIINRIGHKELSNKIYSLLLCGGRPPVSKVGMADQLSSHADRVLYFRELKVKWGREESRIVKHPISNRSLDEMLRCGAEPSGDVMGIIRDLRLLIDLMSFSGGQMVLDNGSRVGLTKFYSVIIPSKLRSTLRGFLGCEDKGRSRSLANLLFPGNSGDYDVLTVVYMWRWLHLMYYYAFLESGLYSTFSKELPDRDLRGLLLFTLDKALPADTRTPYNPLMDHLESTLALSTIFRSGEDLSVLHFSIDGIEEFLSESRTTADFWASSLIVSALTWSAIKGLLRIDEGGSLKYTPANIVYPAQRGSVWMDLYLANLAHKDERRNSVDYFYMIAEERGYYGSSEDDVDLPDGRTQVSIKLDAMNMGRELLSDAFRPEIPGNFLAWVSHEDEIEDKLRGSYHDGLEALLSRTLGDTVNFDTFRRSFTLRPRITKRKWFKLDRGEKIGYWSIIRRAYQGDSDQAMETPDIVKVYEQHTFRKEFRIAHYPIAHHIAKLELDEAPISGTMDEDRIYAIQEDAKCTVCGWRKAVVGWDMELDEKLEKYLKYIRPRERLCPVCLAKRVLGRNKEAVMGLLEDLELLSRGMIDEAGGRSGSLVPSFPSTDDIASAPYAAIVRRERGREWWALMRDSICGDSCDLERMKDELRGMREELTGRLIRVYREGKGGHEVRKYLEDLLSFVDYVERLLSGNEAPASLLYEETYFRVEKALKRCQGIEELEDLQDQLGKLGKLASDLERALRGIKESKNGEKECMGGNWKESTKNFLSLGPSDYYAVLVADVDDVNSLLIGIIGPTVCDRLHPKARRYMLGNSPAAFLKTKALVTPTGHKALSRLLRHFMLYVAPSIVESWPGSGEGKGEGGGKGERIGRMVLAGGDQIYALIPGSEAPFIAARLEEVFSLPIVEVESKGRRNYFYGSDRSLTLTSAVVVAHRFHPVGDAFRRAKRLLREAKMKRKRYGRRWPDSLYSPRREEKVEGWIGIEVITRSNVRRSVLPASSLRKMLELVKVVRGRRCLHCLDRPPLLARSFVRDVQGILKYYGGDIDIALNLLSYWISRNLLNKEMRDEAEGIAREALESLLLYGNDGDRFDPVGEFLHALLVLDRVTGA